MAYQPDRFDEVPEYTDQRGAHRASFAAAAGGARRFSPLLLVAGLVLLAGLFVGVVLPWLTGDRSEPVAAESSASSPAADPSTSSEPASPTEGAATTEPASPSEDAAAEASRSAAAAAEASRSAEAAQAAEASRSAAAAQAAAAARSTHVTVYNATRTPGLAASYAQRLGSAGFTSVSAQNWGGYGIQSSTVLYNGSGNQAAAEAVAAELGFPVLQTPNLQVNGVAVVVTG